MSASIVFLTSFLVRKLQEKKNQFQKHICTVFQCLIKSKLMSFIDLYSVVQYFMGSTYSLNKSKRKLAFAFYLFFSTPSQSLHLQATSIIFSVLLSSFMTQKQEGGKVLITQITYYLLYLLIYTMVSFELNKYCLRAKIKSIIWQQTNA